ncbi:hypothetical protein E4U26_003316 [Claviceps purpurea]|nr:hypothetical protein E4U26_003316 [Claviceps purpurea]
MPRQLTPHVRFAFSPQEKNKASFSPSCGIQKDKMQSYPQRCDCVDCESTYAVYGYPCTAYSYPSRPKRNMPDEFRHEEPWGTTKRARTWRDDDLDNMPGSSAPWYPPTPEATAFEARGSKPRAALDTPVVSTDSYPPVMAYNPVSLSREDGKLPGVGAVLAQAYGNAWVSSNDEISGPTLPPMLGLVPENGPRYAATRMHTWPESGIISPPLEGVSWHVPDNMPAGPSSGHAARGPAPRKTSCRKQTGVWREYPHVPKNCPPNRNNQKYTIEEGDYIVYAREDLSLSWPQVATAFANLFHEGRHVRRLGGLQGWYYRDNVVIPDCDSDGRLVFEATKKEGPKPRLRNIKCRHRKPPRTGFGLGYRHPERGMDYEWVQPDHRRQFQDWGNKRKAQFEAIEERKRRT